MKKREDNPSRFDPNDYPSMMKMILTFFLFPFGFYFIYKTDKEFTLTRRVYALTILLSAFIYFALIVAIIV